MPDPLLPADGNGKIEIVRDGPVLPAQIAGQCPYLVKDVIFGSETGEDLCAATAIRYGLFQNNYPPCTRVCAAISGVHDRDDYRLILPRHTPHRLLRIYSLSKPSRHRGMFAKRFFVMENREDRTGHRGGWDPGRSLLPPMGSVCGYKAPISSRALDSMPIVIYIVRGYTTPMHRVSLPAGIGSRHPAGGC